MAQDKKFKPFGEFPGGLNHPIYTSSVSDFEIDDMTFEVGGKNKSKKQIASVPNGYVVRDDTEFAFGNIIPLYQFGFGY